MAKAMALLLFLVCLGSPALLLATAFDYDGDLSHCISEGGSVNCADCTRPDSLCRQVYDSLSPYDSESPPNEKCTSDYPNAFVDMKFFTLWRGASSSNPRRYCRPMARTSNAEFGFQSDNFFMLGDATNSPYLITKVMLGHPNRADKNIGGIVLKRVLMHKHSVSGEWVGDVYKEAYCIKCPTNIFSSAYTSGSTSSDIDDFYTCAMGAFELDGASTVVKATHKCDAASATIFMAMGTTF